MDSKTSTLHVSAITNNAKQHTYSAYGYHQTALPGQPLLGFNGEPFETASKTYLLGNGYRVYSPRLMRFNSPDSLSPFSAGGINCYCFCRDDPVNHTDPDGHMYKRKTSLGKIPTKPSGSGSSGDNLTLYVQKPPTNEVFYPPISPPSPAHRAPRGLKQAKSTQGREPMPLPEQSPWGERNETVDELFSRLLNTQQREGAHQTDLILPSTPSGYARFQTLTDPQIKVEAVRQT
ncbi:RHS repeat-associated core domain-containing protein [Pseudomonas asiatica]|uniref:RHS repeat-associated core domain-containing protein n=1 Tax=Pseudomonas asiatica TaxID=2219225 RepID=UPI003AF014ED